MKSENKEAGQVLGGRQWVEKIGTSGKERRWGKGVGE
jgi:hypothetical protein